MEGFNWAHVSSDILNFEVGVALIGILIDMCIGFGFFLGSKGGDNI